jgi:N-acetylmuramoyl-L-alanine amidase
VTETIAAPSPNFDDRPQNTPIDILLLHYTGMPTGAAAVARLCDPEAKVSAHYTVDEDGTIFAHVAEERRAWHAGLSWWAGERNVNARSIGIEIVNPGHEFGYRSFPDLQIEAVIKLSRDIVQRRKIPAARVLGHSDVAPARKLDPGELFPWGKLGLAGIGLWPQTRKYPLLVSFEAGLRAFGYGLPPDMDVPFNGIFARQKSTDAPTPNAKPFWPLCCARLTFASAEPDSFTSDGRVAAPRSA